MDNAMTIVKTRTFRSGNSEAVRLPKDVAFGQEVELVIVRSGDVLTLYPAATSIPEMIARLEALPVPPSIEKRDDEELPEPVGL
jgi:antitoxin VapB